MLVVYWICILFIIFIYTSLSLQDVPLGDVFVSYEYVFGPVLFRHIGSALGINNVPSGVCSYSCSYCRFGRSLRLSIDRRPYSNPERIVGEARNMLTKDIDVDCIVFFASGEPTLDTGIKSIVDTIKSKFGMSLGIVTNSSLLWRHDVVHDLLLFDVVVLKIDTVVEDTWRLINRPHRSLSLDDILCGIETFSKLYMGTLITETTLLRKINTSDEELIELAEFLRKINPSTSYISTPPQLVVERWVRQPTEEELVFAQDMLASKLGEDKVSVLRAPEIEKFDVRGDAKEYLLSILNVHPLELERSIAILSMEYDDPISVLRELADMRAVKIVSREGRKFVVRYWES